MAAIAAGNVTYTIAGRSKAPAIEDSSLRYKSMTVTFGNGTLTYPAGGVPLTNLKGNGFPNQIINVELLDASAVDGYVYKWSRANNSIRIYTAPAAAGVGPLTEMAGTATPVATSLYIKVYGS